MSCRFSSIFVRPQILEQIKKRIISLERFAVDFGGGGISASGETEGLCNIPVKRGNDSTRNEQPQSVGNNPHEDEIKSVIVTDSTVVAIILLSPVEDCFCECEGGCDEAYERGGGRGGDVCLVDIG